MSEINKVEGDALAEFLRREYKFASTTDLERLVAAGREKAAAPAGGPGMASIIRGLAASRGNVLNTRTVQADLEVVKALTTGTTPGSYIVPTIQATEIIRLLGTGGVVRSSGARVWPMDGIQNLNVPVATSEPTVEYLDQNADQTATDPGLGQVQLRLKTRRALVDIPNELLSVSSPGVEGIVNELLASALAKHEDRAFFTGIIGGPTAVQDVVGGTDVSQAGATLAYSDLLNVLANFANVEGDGPTAWYCNPMTFFNTVLNMRDDQNRPIIQQDASDSGVRFRLFGAPVWLTTRIPRTLGSPAQLSYILYTNPAYIHVGSGAIEFATSEHASFSKNQSQVRIVNRHDFGYGPAAGIVLLNGVQ